jgi:hypothetical protein
LALASLTGGDRSIGIVRLRTKTTEFGNATMNHLVNKISLSGPLSAHGGKGYDPGVELFLNIMIYEQFSLEKRILYQMGYLILIMKSGL